MASSHVQGEFLYAWTRFTGPPPLPKPTVFNKRLFFNPQTRPVKHLWASSHHARPKITNTNTNTKIKSTKILDLWFSLSKSQIQTQILTQTQILKQTKTHKLKKKKKKEHIIEKQELQQTKKKMVENESKPLRVSYGESMIEGELSSTVRWRRSKEGEWERLKGVAVSSWVWMYGLVRVMTWGVKEGGGEAMKSCGCVGWWEWLRLRKGGGLNNWDWENEIGY